MIVSADWVLLTRVFVVGLATGITLICVAFRIGAPLRFLRLRHFGVDGFTYWPSCPSCGAALSCIGRVPENAVPAKLYQFVCQGPEEHRSQFTHGEIMAVQEAQARKYA